METREVTEPMGITYWQAGDLSMELRRDIGDRTTYCNGQVKPEAFIFPQPSSLGTSRDTERIYLVYGEQSRIVEIVRRVKRVIHGQMSPQVCRPQVMLEEDRQLGK